MTLIQKLAVFYAFMFFGVVGMNYVPAFHDANGMMFGLFSLQWYDDLLHAFSGVWAGIAAFISHRQSVLYFKLFGGVYLLDGVLGLPQVPAASMPGSSSTASAPSPTSIFSPASRPISRI